MSSECYLVDLFMCTGDNSVMSNSCLIIVLYPGDECHVIAKSSWCECLFEMGVHTRDILTSSTWSYTRYKTRAAGSKWSCCPVIFLFTLIEDECKPFWLCCQSPKGTCRLFYCAICTVPDLMRVCGPVDIKSLRMTTPWFWPNRTNLCAYCTTKTVLHWSEYRFCYTWLRQV